MSAATPISFGLVVDVFNVLERHGFHRADDEHAGRAVLLLGDLARTYAGAEDTPPGTAAGPAPEIGS